MPRPDPKFTPGQWEVISRREIADDPKYIVIGAGNTGAAIVGQYEGMEVDRRWANARLIAAAPNLHAVASSVSISGPDADGLMWLHVTDGALHGMFNLGEAGSTIATRALLGWEEHRAAALARADGAGQ